MSDPTSMMEALARVLREQAPAGAYFNTRNVSAKGNREALFARGVSVGAAIFPGPFTNVRASLTGTRDRVWNFRILVGVRYDKPETAWDTLAKVADAVTNTLDVYSDLDGEGVLDAIVVGGDNPGPMWTAGNGPRYLSQILTVQVSESVDVEEEV